MRTYLIHYSSDIGLKAQNRRDFIRQLRRNIRRQHPAVQSVEHLMGRLVALSPQEEDFSDVFGVAWWAEARRLPLDWDAIVAEAVALARRHARPGMKFAVRARRAEKRFPLNSQEIGREVGAAIVEATGMGVDLTNPDLEVFVEIAPEAAFVFAERHAGPQGLPVGTSGHWFGLYSGGIDSVVAAYLMGRRGARVDLVHFHVFANAEPARSQKVGRLAAMLGKYLPGLRVFYVPMRFYREQISALPRRYRPYRVVAFRRFMVRVAAALAREHSGQALFTGDNLGQVASQTIENMLAVNAAVDFPIFRPLLAFQKQEIIDLGERLGFYELAKQPYEDGCTMMAQRPSTKVRIPQVEELESHLDLTAAIEQTLAAVEIDHPQSLNPSIP